MARGKDYLIYALEDPRNGRVRYVGLSSSGLRRPKTHAKPAKHVRHLPVSRWGMKLKRLGIDYTIHVLERASGYEQLKEQERFWIRVLRAAGCPLLNLTDGGDGTLGFKYSDKSKAAMSASSRSRWSRAEERTKASTGQKRRYQDPAEREANRGAQKRAWAGDPERLLAFSNMSRAYWATEEARQNQSARRKAHFANTPDASSKLSIAKGGRPLYDARGREFVTQTEAAAYYGIPQSGISGVLRGEQAQTKGYMFTHKPPPSKANQTQPPEPGAITGTPVSVTED